MTFGRTKTLKKNNRLWSGVSLLLVLLGSIGVIGFCLDLLFKKGILNGFNLLQSIVLLVVGFLVHRFPPKFYP